MLRQHLALGKIDPHEFALGIVLIARSCWREVDAPKPAVPSSVRRCRE